MAKIPFSIKYRPQIEGGEYKVETRDGIPVRIICWDANCYTPIVFLATEHDDLDGKDKEYPYSCNNFGRSFSVDSPNDLFIITPEPELSAFEKALEVFLMNADSSEETFHEEVKKHAAELLALARDQFIKDGYVIEKKAFHDAVEKVAPEVMKEVSDKVDMEEALRLGYEKGRADALKDLPRWKKCNFQIGSDNPFPRYLVKTGAAHYSLTSVLLRCDEYIPLSELAKLPNEDSHE